MHPTTIEGRLDQYEKHNWYKPMQHQIEAAERALKLSGHYRHIFNWDMGTGKTLAMLGICDELGGKTVVVCPKAIIDNAWLSDAKRFPRLRVLSLRVPTSRQRMELIHSETWDVLCCNYELFKKHVDDFLVVGVERLILDESSALKNFKSQQTLAALNMAAGVPECFLLSGTPAPNGPHEWWAQLRCVDRSVDANFYRFCNRYFVAHKRNINGREVVTGWSIKESAREAFEQLLAKNVWSLLKEDCIDLPPRIDVYRSVTLSKAESDAYDRLASELKAETNEGRTISIAAQAKLMKLRQLTGGQFYADKRPVVVGDSKLEELCECLQEIGDKPVVIWAEFTSDIDRIAERLRDKGAAIIDGRTPDAVRPQAIAEFGKSIRYLVCHPKAVGHGITLVQSCYAIYFSLSFSYETYAQSRDRIHRYGQSKPCTYIHLVADETCDRRVLAVLQRKGTAADAMRAAIAGSE